LLKRAMAELLFKVRTFATLLAKLRRGDVRLTVLAPFMLPYAFAAAAKLKSAKSVLIMHDLYPDVLVMAGLLQPQSIVAKAMRALNAPMFRALDAVVIIGRDTEKLLLRYRGMTRDKIRFIPNRATLERGVRAATLIIVSPFAFCPFRRWPVRQSRLYPRSRHRVRGRAAAARRQGYPLPAVGLGGEVRSVEGNAVRGKLPNVTLVDRVEDEQLEAFLSAADVWIIPYRRNVAGVSVPSRFYNLLAIGRPVILVSEPDAEAALTVIEHDVGWVVEPGNADQLAKAVSRAAGADDPQRAERAAEIARRFDFEIAMADYCGLIRELAQK
jgi:colanic acid biosynthesis glycosyl transferase WcaI